MSGSTLPVLSRPDFPQVLEAAIDHALFRTWQRIAPPQLGSCCHEETYRESGWSCQERAIVSDLNTGLAFCARHWRAVGRG